MNVFKSADAGSNWNQFNWQLTDNYVHSVVVEPVPPLGNPNDPYDIYCSNGNGLFKKTMNLMPPFGGYWSALNAGGLPESSVDAVRHLAIDHQNPDILYAGTGYHGIYKSTDGGSNWNSLPGSPATAVGMVMDPQDPMILYVFTNVSSGLHKTVDGGNNWFYANSGLQGIWLASLAIDPGNNSILYASSNNAGGIFKSTNGGTNWVLLAGGAPDRDVSSLVIDPNNTNTIYAGHLGSGVFKSTNAGQTWFTVNNGLGITHVNYLLIDPANTNIIYAGAYGYGGYGVYKSWRGGSRWMSFNNGLNDGFITTMAMDTRASTKTVYAGTGFGAGLFSCLVRDLIAMEIEK